MIKKSGTEIWMDIYNKPADSKQYVPFTSNHSRHCLTNIPFSLARKICTIAENGNVKERRFKELKKKLLEQKYLTETSTLRAKEIPVEVLRQPKTTKSEEIIIFTIAYNSNNPNVFPIVKQSFDNFEYFKTMSNIFQRKKLVKSTRQAPNLGRLLCRSKFESQHKNHEVKNCGKKWVICPHLLKASLYQFKQANKTFFLKNSFNCESSNLIYFVICQGCKEEAIHLNI